MDEFAFKICLFGDSCVGKTTLTNRYLKDEFKSDTKQTMGAQIFVKYLEIEGIRIVLQIWDFGGEENFQFLLSNYAMGSSGGIYMYDISNKKSLESVETWISVFKEFLLQTDSEKKEIPIIMVGGKSDLEREVSHEEALKECKRNNLIDIIECSSKTGENVEKIFEILVRKIMQKSGLLVSQ